MAKRTYDFSIPLPRPQVLRSALLFLLAAFGPRDGSVSPSKDLLRTSLRHLRNRSLWRAVLAAMLITLAFIAFWPTPVDRPVQGQLADILQFLHGLGIPSWVNYKFVETSANVLLFVPLGFVSKLALPEKQSWRIGAFGLLISGCMELGQLLFLHNRFSSPLDLVTNTSGAILGALLAIAALKKLEAPRLSAADLQ